MEKNFILKGDIAYSVSLNEIMTYEAGYLVCKAGIVEGAFEQIPDAYKNFPIYDCGESLIIPGMTDLHVHAPQYTFRGIGMDMELLEWLSTHTFPEEAKYSDIEYAKKAYEYFCYDLQRSFTTRACIFATLHSEATILLMELLEKTGLITYVGKVNMDRNGGDNLQEKDAKTSFLDTKEWLNRIAGRFENTMPIITPRFIPSCSDELMEQLGGLAEENNLKIQSHLSENVSEIEWVKELVPAASSYANAYEIFNNMGCDDRPSIMAHCVYSNEEEIRIIKEHGAYVAHCPNSNMNLTSGIAPVRKFIEAGLNIGLGTDVAAGSSLNMLATILDTIQASKMYYRLVDTNVKPLTFEEAFGLATLKGGSYFGNVGSFLKGHEFDAVIIDDSKMVSMRKLSVRERVERICYNDADCVIEQKFVKGKLIFSNVKS